ncbi:hypothetical protein, partial [Fervidibacter sacchari]
LLAFVQRCGKALPKKTAHATGLNRGLTANLVVSLFVDNGRLKSVRNKPRRCFRHSLCPASRKIWAREMKQGRIARSQTQMRYCSKGKQVAA